MTRIPLGFAGALLLATLSSASAAPSDLQLEYHLKPSDVLHALRVGYERVLDEHSSDGLILTRPYVTSISFEPETRWTQRNLDGQFELRTTFVSKRPLRLTADERDLALRRLAGQHRIEVSMTAYPSAKGAERSLCGCQGEHQPNTEHLDGTPGASTGSVTRLRPAANLPVRVELVPKRILLRSESPLYWASRYEVVWSGQVRYEGSLEQRVALLRGLSGEVRASLSPGPELDAAMTQLVCAALELLDKKRLRESLAREDAPTPGVTELLGPQEVAREKKTRTALLIAKGRVDHGDFVAARHWLDQAQAKFSPEVEALEARIAAKERSLLPILATSQSLLQANEPGVARRLVESFYFADGKPWRWSSVVELEYARVLLAVGDTEWAQRALNLALRHDPGLRTDPEVLRMQAELD